MKKIFTSSLLSRLIRPIAWIVFFLPFSAGFFISVDQDIPVISVVFSFFSFFFIMSFGFTVNAIGDSTVDSFHDGHSKDMDLSLQPLVTGEITLSQAKILSFLFFLGSMVSGIWINIQFLISILLIAFIGYIYSLPPFRFKQRALLDILCNALLGTFCFVAGASIGTTPYDSVLILAVVIMAANFYIPTVLTDFEFDKKADIKTSAVTFGGRRLLYGMYVLTVVLILTAAIVYISGTVEHKILSGLMMVYTPVFTLATKYGLKNNHLTLHQNWILLPFGVVSVVFTVIGFFKVFV